MIGKTKLGNSWKSKIGVADVKQALEMLHWPQLTSFSTCTIHTPSNQKPMIFPSTIKSVIIYCILPGKTVYQNISLKIRYIAVFCDISWDFCISIFLIISKVDISMEIYRHLEIYRRQICYFDIFKHIIFCDISINKQYFLYISKIYRKDINNIPKIKYFFQNVKILIYHQISFL